MASTTVKLGKDAVLYRNTASWGTPTWVAIPNCADLSVDLDMDEGDGSVRGAGGYALAASTLLKAALNFAMNYDTADTNWTTLQGAFFNRTKLDLFAADATVATGVQGFRAMSELFKFSQKQPLKDVQKTDVQAKPTAIDYSNLPIWYTSP